jgi:serine/threonine protein kinase
MATRVALSAGTRIGPYEVVAAVGAGGMGEVYRCHDTRLDRRVAIKIIAGPQADDPEFRHRLTREARAISSLNHPNIRALYDVGEHEGAPYLVMEFLEGETLADRLARSRGRPIEPRAALEIFISLATALDAAHRAGIVHRDIKPANVFLAAGTGAFPVAKLLDFGLAKPSLVQLGSAAGEPAPVTVSERLTREGTILGTPQYMAPEQLCAGETDQRTDIFALGALAYEMVSGRTAFEGSTPASLVAAILEHEPPPLSSLKRDLPPSLDRVIRACLEKNPDDRWQSARDLRRALEWVRDERDRGRASSPRTSVRGAWTAAVIAALVAAGALVAVWRPASRAPDPLVASLAPPPNTFPGMATVSPDGRTIVFSAIAADGGISLYARHLNTGETKRLDGTQNAHSPCWSPDSRSVAFLSGHALKAVDPAGGQPQTIADVPMSALGTSWNRDNVIIVGSAGRDGIIRVDTAGGTPAPIPAPQPRDTDLAASWPSFLPDGRHFVYFTDSTAADRRGVWLGAIDAAERRFLFSADSQAQYSDPGYLLFVRDQELIAQPFSLRSLAGTGEPVHVARDISTSFFSLLGQADFSVSTKGVLVYHTGRNQQVRLVWFDRTGKPIADAAKPMELSDQGFSLSADQRTLAVPRVEAQTGTRGIWLLDAVRGAVSRLTVDPFENGCPVWAPDGSRVAFSSRREHRAGIYTQAPGGTATTIWTADVYLACPTDWSRDGRYILSDVFEGVGGDIWVVPTAPGAKAYPRVRTSASEYQGQFSPDGRWIAYSSEESGRHEIYVEPFAPGGRKIQVSNAGGGDPRWRHDGRELYYLAPDRTLMAVDITPGEPLDVGVPRALFVSGAFPINRNQFVASPDGQRFLFEVSTEEAASPLTLVVNWSAASSSRN